MQMADNPTTLTCTFHPKRETKLRCNRCNRPICVQCAKPTPTGYRCPECIRSQQKAFITVRWYDYIIAVILTGLFSFLGSLLAVPFGFFTLFIAPVAGTITEFVVRKAISNRKSPLLFKIIGVTAFAGSLPVLIIQGFSGIKAVLKFGISAAASVFPFVWILLYAVMITSTVYYRFAN